MTEGEALRADVDRFYSLLDRLSSRCRGPRLLKDCDGRMPWPRRGIYFFFEIGEGRGVPHVSTSRIVRVGTHAVSAGSETTLWDRLKQHRGNGRPGEPPGGGNHRGSIFRRDVGEERCTLRPSRTAD